jgi:hypothetical protein
MITKARPRLLGSEKRGTGSNLAYLKQMIKILNKYIIFCNAITKRLGKKAFI